jgi:ribonuclease HI
VGALLAQEDEHGKERPVYYISRLMRGLEVRYLTTKKIYLSLVFLVQKFRHYFLGHEVHLVSKSNPVKYLLKRPLLLGRTAKWALTLSEFDIKCIGVAAIRGQVVADLLANSLELKSWSYLMVIEEEEWQMYFDGLSTVKGGRADVVLMLPSKEHVFAYMLDFPCSNNEAEYEALLVGLRGAKELGVKKLQVFGDSELVIRQYDGFYVVKSANLAVYKAIAQKLVPSFLSIEFNVIGRNDNRLADSLGTLASRSKTKVKVKKRPESQVKKEEKPKDWRKTYLDALAMGEVLEATTLWHLKDFIPISRTLYRKGQESLLMRCVSREEELAT